MSSNFTWFITRLPYAFSLASAYWWKLGTFYSVVFWVLSSLLALQSLSRVQLIDRGLARIHPDLKVNTIMDFPIAVITVLTIASVSSILAAPIAGIYALWLATVLKENRYASE